MNVLINWILSQKHDFNKNTGVGCHFLLQGIFLTLGSNQCLMSPALAGRFFSNSTTLPALGEKSLVTKNIGPRLGCSSALSAYGPSRDKLQDSEQGK